MPHRPSETTVFSDIGLPLMSSAQAVRLGSIATPVLFLYRMIVLVTGRNILQLTTKTGDSLEIR
jgi:hypothetical protein